MEIEMLETLLYMLVAGSLVGFVSSFFGVGACFIMVPVMDYCFTTFLGVHPSIATLIAFGTNMAVVVPTSISGFLRHRRELTAKGLSFPVGHYLRFALPVGVGSLMGAAFAFVFFSSFRAEAGVILKVLFGLFCLFGAYRFMTAKPRPVDSLKPPSTVGYAISGVVSGFLAHFIGIGGGIVYMPVLNTFLQIPVHFAVPLSIATMIIGSSVGAVSFAVLGHLDQIRHPADYPPMTFGWFNLYAWLGLGVTSIILAQLGPRVAHRTSPQRYKVLLGIVYAYIGVRLVVNGVFWLQGLHPPIP
mgnify:FL=1